MSLMPSFSPHMPDGRDPYFANVSLLLHMNGTDGSNTFIDSSPLAHTMTAANQAQIDTAQSKFGGASGLFDGFNDYVYTPNHAGFKFGANNFTVEFWIRATTVSGVRQIINTGTSGSANLSYSILASGTSLLYYLSSNGSSWDLANGVNIGTIATGTWHHVALTWDGSTYRAFLDGVAGTSTTSSTALFDHNGPTFLVGMFVQTVITGWKGWIDDVRITKGVARYTANFTPPTAEFPDA